MRVDQCLFGYDDGHRLLASSLRLSGEVLSQLAQLSDLAPGTRFGRAGRYWTGLPAPRLGRYVLMCTWPAPEMSRPGCVWTHALLIDTSLFEHASDLSQLQNFLRKPDGIQDREAYRESIDAALMQEGKAPAVFSAVDTARGAEIINQLYGDGDGPVVVGQPGELDSLIFAIWSQQWPKLRRNFRFQTAASRELSASYGIRFDLQLQLGAPREPTEYPRLDHWIEAASEDLTMVSTGRFRRFLWQYGVDVRRQRGSFRPLSELFVLDREVSGDIARVDLPNFIARAFPEPDDATTLKQDVVDGVILSRFQLDVLTSILVEKGESVFPRPKEEGIARLATQWPARAEEMLALAERAIESDDKLALSILNVVIRAIPASHFWTLTRRFSKVRRSLVEERPDLLDSDSIKTLEAATLVELLSVVPDRVDFAPRLVERLVSLNDADLARVTMLKFPSHTIAGTLTAIDRQGAGPVSAWLRAVADQPALLLAPNAMQGVRRSATLYCIADAVGWMSPFVLRAGTHPWIVGLNDTLNDLPTDDADTLRAFFVALSIAVGDQGAQILLEKFFAPLHDRILRSFLPWRASNILMPYLPNVGWLRNWDVGLRLRLAIAHTYVAHNLDTKSFAALSDNGRIQSMLAQAAEETIGGQRYAKAI